MERNRKFFEKYELTEDGIVIIKKTGHIVPHQINKSGYHYVGCHIEGKVMNFKVSRMVAFKYLPNPMNYPEVNHKDGNKNNNHWSNLEWCTSEMNREHARINGLMVRGEKHPFAVMKDAEVISVRERLRNGESFKKTYRDYEHKISWSMFRDICRGRSWKHLL